MIYTYGKYIDPSTGQHVVLEGNCKRISSKLQRVASLLMMKKNSVPKSTFFTCGIRDITKGGKTLPTRICAEIDKALRPWKTTETHEGLFDSYTRTAWMVGNICYFRVQIQNKDAIESVVVPITAPVGV
jgi:hypothetical protein